MSATTLPNAPLAGRHASGEPLRVAFVGARKWLDSCAPVDPAGRIAPRSFIASGGEEMLREQLAEFRPGAVVIFDPPSMPLQALRSLQAPSLGVLVDPSAEHWSGASGQALDRLVSFDPALTGERVGDAQVWRAVPPPVSDRLYRDPRALHGTPRAMTIGRSTEHRETMLMPAKHHHDVLQVIHGVSGVAMAQLLQECDVGIYVAPEPGGGFGHQVPLHLAAGHLLLCEQLRPAHGLERNIDYLQIDSAEGLVWVLDRLGRFPEMYRRICVRGRLKAEQYRASRIFARLVGDMLLDISAFGR